MIIAILAAMVLDGQMAASTPEPVTTPASVTGTLPVSPATKGSVADDDKVVCKSEQVTGSRFAHRICHTKAQWAQIEKDSRDELMDQQSQSYRNPTNGH